MARPFIIETMQVVLAVVLVFCIVLSVQAFTGPAFGRRVVSNSKLYADVDITFPNGKKAKVASGSSMKDGT